MVTAPRPWACVAIAGVLACLLPAVSSPSSTAGPAVRVRTYQFVDRSRTIKLPDGRHVPRPVETIVRYPAAGGPYPLIVFGHGFTLTPAPYTALLRAWASAGYVVAAPVFPLENANAPGGPTEADLVNQPRDMSFVISKLLRALHTKIDPSRIAVAGHSDGAETALAVAYDSRYRDPRVRAAIILSGSALPGTRSFPQGSPPLLAVQGTADTINRPSSTSAYFAIAQRPKFLLWLLGAQHKPPYTDQEPQLRIVERATIAFLNHYLGNGPLGAFTKAAHRPGLTRLVSDP